MYNIWECKRCGSWCDSGHDHDIIDCQLQQSRNKEKESVKPMLTLEERIKQIESQLAVLRDERDGILNKQILKGFYKVKGMKNGTFTYYKAILNPTDPNRIYFLRIENHSNLDKLTLSVGSSSLEWFKGYVRGKNITDEEFMEVYKEALTFVKSFIQS